MAHAACHSHSLDYLQKEIIILICVNCLIAFPLKSDEKKSHSEDVPFVALVNLFES